MVELNELAEKVRDHAAAKAELEAVRQANAEGLLVAEEVVARAADEESALHGYFTWDDTEAARQHRLSQARGLIRTIEVWYQEDGQERRVPRYVSLETDRKRAGGGYREVRKVLNSKQLLAELEATARKELEAWTRRYQVLTGLVQQVAKAAGIGGKPKKK